MTDRELLELAAKAAGIEINASRQSERDAEGYGHVGLWTTTSTNWNPLTDDGDALRLAVKVDMLVDFSADEGWVDIMGKDERIKEVYGGAPMTATRRAIVRAAAEIGRSM